MPFLSVELGKHRFKVLLLERGRDSISVLQDLSLTILPTEDFKDKVSGSLRDFIQKYGVTDRKVFLTIADPGVILLRNTVLPVMAPAEIVPALQWHAKEEGLLSDDSVLYNYEVVYEFTGEDEAKRCAVTFSVVNKKLLDNSIQILTKLGLEVIQVTAAPLNTAKVLATCGDPADSKVVLDLGYGASTLSIYNKGKLLFSRTLSISFSRARACLNDPVFLGPKFRTPEAEKEIDQAMLSIEIPRDEQALASGEKPATQFYGLLRPILESLVREIRYSLNFFTSNIRMREPQLLFLTGHAPKLRGLDGYLTQALGMTVSNLELPGSVRFEEASAEGDSVRMSQCVSALAGVLPGAGGVDFMPYEIQCQKSESYQRSFLRVVSLVAVGGCLVAFFLMQLRITSLSDHVKIQQKYLQALGRFAQISQTPFERYQLARTLEEGTIPPDKVLRLLGHLIPSGLSIREVTVDSATRSVTMAVETSGLDEAGNALITDFLRRLKETRFLASVKVQSVPGFAVSVYRVEGVFRDA